MKQKVFKNERRKAILTRDSNKRYFVAFFSKPDLLTADYGVIEFKKLKDATYSAECHLI